MIKIYYMGYDSSHPGDFVFDIPEGHNWLLLLTQTPAEFWVDGEMKEYPPNSAVLYKPQQKILYRACRDSYINDWVRFDTNDSYVLETQLPLGVPFPLPDPDYCHKIYQLLASEFLLKNDYSELSVDYLFRVLFNKLNEAIQDTRNSPHYQNLLNLRRAIQNNPGNNWTIPLMAERLNLSTGYLQKIYKTAFGISCMSDVINHRIRFAKEHLAHSSQTINEIAARCGYSNVEHFCRQFHQLTGSTPSDYRKST